ncbi:MAG: class II aldolase/adducin family protein [Christensenellales bacterium]|nr:class II aldolase/adducin family protein [Christensenellales bacterium]
MAFTEKELRQMVKDAGVRMLEENLVQGTWGNISIRLDEKHALVTPSGLDYVVMTPDDLPVVDIETLEWTGPRKPTSERKIHAAILRARPEINVVLHSHPTWGATFASTHLSLPAFNDKMKKYLLGDVRCAKYGLAGTKKLTKNTVAAMEGRNACFLANHGVFVCGKTLEDAFEACRALEEGCKTYIKQKTVEKAKADKYTTELSLELFKKTYKK